MSQSYESEYGAGEKGQAVDKRPDIGIVANGEDDDAIARICLRARSNGHEVIIDCHGDTAPGIPEIADVPGVYVNQLNSEAEESNGSHNHARERLEVAAHTKSANGLIVVEDTSVPIDFQRSLQKFEEIEGFVSEAIPRPARGIEILVAIPAYNEAKTIGSVVEKASAYSDAVLVIDDGSADETAAKAEETDASVIRHDRNRGYGGALKTAFETADKWDVECLVIIDGDDQHDVDDIPTLTSKVINEGANVSIGSRFAGDGRSEIPLYRRFGLGLVNVMSNVSMGAISPRSWVSDTQSGFRAYDRHAIEHLANAGIGDDMEASLDILYHLRGSGFQIEEVSTVVDYDIDQGHSQNPFTHGVRLVSSILRTLERDHPVKFLGVPGVLMALLGSGFGYAAMVNYLSSQTFPLGLALVSVFLILLGVFSGFTAIMLHSLNAHLAD